MVYEQLPEELAAWIGKNVPGLGDALELHRLTGGNSNLTYRVVGQSGDEVVLRCPPHQRSKEGGAHDLEREFRVLTALHPTAIPVPEPIAYCSDPSIGSCYLMEFVRGLTVDSTVVADLSAAARGRLGHEMFEVLAGIHHLEPAELGIGDLAPLTGYMPRQVERWKKQAMASANGVPESLELILELSERLIDRLPADRPGRLIHGDFGIQNCLSGPDGELLAVLDWELCTIGDPAADLATSLAYWTDPEDLEPVFRKSVSRLPGFPRRAELLRRYTACSPEPLPDLQPYEAFAYWKMACVFLGVARRYRRGTLGADEARADRFEASALRLVRQASHLLESAGARQ